MSLTTMSPSAWSYYVEEVAKGREDYFSRGAEHPGEFIGRGAEALGVAGEEADAVGLSRLFGEGSDPRSGAPLGRTYDQGNERAVAGYALTFSPPKSVSVLWALADEEISGEVLSAHEAAVDSSLSFLEDHAAFTRRGHNGVLQVDTDGLIGASFVHRTSRAADPQLHSHVLLANKVRTGDGRWLALDGRELFATQKATGMLYKAALRAELTNRLGVSWGLTDDNGAAEIEGVPSSLIEHWSARRQQVKTEAEGLIASRETDLGRSLSDNERTKCFQIAAYRTRTPKVDGETSTEDLRVIWRSEAIMLGRLPQDWMPRVVSTRSRAITSIPSEHVAAEVILRLEDKSATWSRARITEEVARLVQGRDAEAVRSRVEELTDYVISDAEVLSLGAPLQEVPSLPHRRDGMAATERHGSIRFTTRTTLAREAEILELVHGGRDAHVGLVDEDLVERVLASCDLGEDQKDAVAGLVMGGERVALLVGPAGAGKSRALDTARQAWCSQGLDPIGLAPSAMAAQVLSEEAGLRSETLAKFLYDHEHNRSHFTLDERSIVVLDEAGMARTDDLAKLLRLVEEHGSKAVLVGDPHQLGPVGPGGIFGTLVADHGGYELETIRRFDHAWEAAASLRLRQGNEAVLHDYDRHSRIEGGSRSEMIDAAFAAWRDALDNGERLLLMAGDNATANELAARCRSELASRRYIGGDAVPIATGVVSQGDHVVTLQNARSIRTSRADYIRNGGRFMVTATASDGSLSVVSLEHKGSARLPASYVREHVALGYALTVHKAQGRTTQRAALVVDEHMSASQLYVGMSRGRKDNRAFVICSDDDPDDHVRRPAKSPLEVLAAVMRHDDGNRSAHDVLRRNLKNSEHHHPTPSREQTEPTPARRDPYSEWLSRASPMTRRMLASRPRSPSQPTSWHQPPTHHRGVGRRR